ncbi:MAG: DUF3788 family protein [Mangrovibacterium sp.]
MKSIFTDKNKLPNDNDLKESLDDTYQLWQMIRNYVISKYPKGFEEWSCSKYGWSFRIKDKKRAIIYFLPRDKYFKIAFVFGQKATDAIMVNDISSEIKKELEQSPKYAEGRGIRIDIKNDILISDIKKLIEIKLDN